MKKFSQYILFGVLLFSFLIAKGGTIEVGAVQDQKKIDSLLKVGWREIYENPDLAISLGNTVYKNERNATKVRIKGLFLISTAYSSKRNYQKSLKYARMANLLSKETSNVVLKAQVLNVLAGVYQELKIYDKAIHYLNESEKICLSHPVRDSVKFTLGNNYIIKGFIYKEQLNCDIAINFFKKGIQEYMSLNTLNTKSNTSIAQYNIGNCYILSSEYDEAKKYFEKSIHSGILAKANSLQAFGQKGLAEVYTLQGEYQLAVLLLNQALKTSKSVGDLVLNQEIYKGLSENYLALGALEKYKKYSAMYLKVQLAVKKSQRESIGDSIEEVISIKNEKIKALKKRFQYVLLSSIILSLLLIMGTFLKVKKDKKIIFSLKNTLKSLQKRKISES